MAKKRIPFAAIAPARVVHIVRERKAPRDLTASVKFYTRFVALSKHFLWILVAAILVLVVWVASYNSSDNGARIVFSSVPHSDLIQPVMTKPRYQGMDAHNQPYTVTAEQATQKDANTVLMESVNADLMQQSGRWLGLNAKTGELNMQNKQMFLSGGVSIFADGGYEFRTDHASVDIQQGSATGDSHVEGQGPPGTLTADGFYANSRQHVIRFNGSVRMVLYH